MSVPQSQEVAARPRPRLHVFTFHRHARLWMALVLLLSDALSLFLAGLAAVGLRFALGNLVNPPFYWSLVPFTLLFLALYLLSGLYPAVGLNPVEELRRLSISTSLVFLFITAFTFWVRTAEYYSRLIFAFAWVFALVAVPLGRWLGRTAAMRLGWWGEPVAIIGCGQVAIRTAAFLNRRPHFGLRPVLFVDCNDQAAADNLPLPTYTFVLGNGLERLLRESGIHTAILADGELPGELREAILNEQYLKFDRLILISDLSWIGSLGVIPYDLEGLLGLELRQNLLHPWDQRLKRLVDLAFTLLLGLLAFPLILLIALLVRLDSPGPSFFGHARVGRGNRSLVIWKFRTMVDNADQVLQQHLDQHPEARREWQQNQKLKNDPRLTRMGRLLRRSSLDELPQFWNILRGEMSLVGPRPIVRREIELYQKGFTLYQRVLPGLTGLWQVSGRNDLGYNERVRLDEYYVRNWSLWLDIYILARTFGAVLRRQGAY